MDDDDDDKLWMVQYRPASSYNSPFFTTNSGAPVWNNNSSMTVGPRGKIHLLFPKFYTITLNYTSPQL